MSGMKKMNKKFCFPQYNDQGIIMKSSVKALKQTKARTFWQSE